jgi:predicted RecB family nuclease
MARFIKDHTKMLGVRGKTVLMLAAIEIETLEDLAEASIDRITQKLKCTTERAMVLINRARRAVLGHHSHGLCHRGIVESADPTDTK